MGLSERYRAAKQDGSGYFTSAGDIAAYAAYRMPATYAAVHATLKEAAERLPDYHPHTLLDAGAGPGTAAWAAATIWPDLTDITLIEREPGMIALGKRLAGHSSIPAIREGRWVQADLLRDLPEGRYDITVLSYALNELQDGLQAKLIHALWEQTDGLLIIVEPGTPAGFLRIKQARNLLLAQGTALLAPCPHGGPCPMEGTNWCHFSARVARSRLHRQAKGAELSYEDEKFSYLVAAKIDGAVACQACVLRHPQVRKGHVLLELCTGDGLKQVVVSKSQGEKYRLAKDLKWGSAYHL